MSKKAGKKKGRPRKKNNLVLSYFGVFLVLIIITGSFGFGLLMGFKKGISESPIERPSIIAQAREINSVSVLPTEDVKVPILVYHYIEFVKDQRDTIRKSLDILPPTLESQIKTLKSAGYSFIVAADLGLYLDGKKPLPQKPIILTFDDGYEDFYTDVFPILKKYNVVATEYIISGVLGRPNYMTLDQVKEIAASGLVEIGAHTVHHPNLKSLSIEIAKKEIEDSKATLESELGINVVSFAYPYGAYDDAIVSLVKNAGYTNAVTTRGGFIVNQNERLTLFRIHPGVATGQGLISIL